MKLGENIRAQRREKGLSQETLAEMLEVSRQSVYKWESDQAQPELEKLIKLSAIFGVSLDELVKGTQPEKQTIIIEKEPEKRNNKSGVISLCFAGAIAIGFTMLGAAAAGLILALPFLFCALVCFNVKHHATLWCVWVWYGAFYIFLRFGTGLSPWTVINTFIWTAEMNYFRLVIAWAMFIATVVMIVATVRAFKPEKTVPSTKAMATLCIFWVATAAVVAFPINGIILRYVHNQMQFYATYGVLVTFLHTVQELGSYVLIIVSARRTWAMVRKEN